MRRVFGEAPAWLVGDPVPAPPVLPAAYNYVTGEPIPWDAYDGPGPDARHLAHVDGDGTVTWHVDPGPWTEPVHIRA